MPPTKENWVLSWIFVLLIPEFLFVGRNPARVHAICLPRMPGGSGNSWFQFSVSTEPANTSPIT